MQRLHKGEGLLRKPPVPNGPTVEVLFGGDENGSDVGVIRISVPVGASMPAHRHGGSDIVLLPQAGSIELTTADTSFDVGVGDAAYVHKDEEVALRNSGDTPAELIVAAAPTNFVTGVHAWPEPTDG